MCRQSFGAVIVLTLLTYASTGQSREVITEEPFSMLNIIPCESPSG